EETTLLSIPVEGAGGETPTTRIRTETEAELKPPPSIPPPAPLRKKKHKTNPDHEGKGKDQDAAPESEALLRPPSRIAPTPMRAPSSPILPRGSAEGTRTDGDNDGPDSGEEENPA